MLLAVLLFLVSLPVLEVALDTGALTAGGLIVLWGVIQTFLLEYLYWVKDWFVTLSKKQKKTVNALALLVVVVIIYLLSLFEVINAFSPDLTGALAAVTAYVGALGIGQGVHQGTKREKPVIKPE